MISFVLLPRLWVETMYRNNNFRMTLLFCGLLFCAGSLPAAGKKATPKADPGLAAVEKVLRAEVAGPVDRRERLAGALQEVADSPSVRWQAGFVRDSNSWKAFDEARDSASNSAVLTEYQSLRRQAGPAFSAQLELANWCKQHGLIDQERSHLSVALEAAPDAEKPALRSRLGYLLIGNQWLTRADLEQWRDFNQRALDSLKRWGAKLERISRQLEGTAREREAGQTNLAQMRDPTAIPAMEYVLCSNEAAVEPAVAALSRIPEYEATIALARQAAFSMWPKVRKQSATALKNRMFDDFVPGLIACTASPASTTHTNNLVYLTERDARGMESGVIVLLHSYIIARETDDQFQVNVLRTADYRISDWLNGQTVHFLREERGRGDGIGRTRLNYGLVLRQLQLNRDYESQVQQLVAEQNDRTQELNQRIINVLSTVSGQDSVPDLKGWWQWWENFSDTQQASAKPTAVVVNEDYVGNASTRFYRMSCFAAGTPVWTDRGPLAIETIQVGDRVLAQDVESGELAYKPVLKTTVRPPKELTTLRLADETIVCTGGHRLWSSSQGWVKARDLTSQSLLHTVTGNTSIFGATKGETAPTYNLVVADFHTYFVGKTGVLCQDLLPPQRTNNIVPGLSRKNAVAEASKK